MAQLQEATKGNFTYLNIVGGQLAEKSREGEVGAVRREYEDKDGNKKVKFERYYNNVKGIITGISFRDTDYGMQMSVVLDNEVVVSMNTSSNYFTDFAKKLKKVKLENEVVIAPYNFEDDNGKDRRGVTVYQEGEKIAGDYYYDKETKVSINGFPQVDQEKAKSYDSDDWKVYFIKVKKFLIDEVEKISSTIEKNDVDSVDDDVVSMEDDNIPF